MTTLITAESVPDTVSVHPALSWGAVFAGCFTALGVHLLLLMLGLSLGVAFVSPDPGGGDLPELSGAAGIVWAVCALISLWIGGWVAGRTGRAGFGNIGGLHGLLVWCLSTVALFAFLSGGTGLLIGGALQTVGRGLTASAAAAAPARPNEGIGPPRPAGLLDSFLAEAVEAPDAGGAARLRRELGSALWQAFRENNPSGREALLDALVQGGRSRADAERLVQSWEQAYARARQAAESAAARAARSFAKLSAWTFLAFALGAFAAAWGGRCGHRRSTLLRVRAYAESELANP
jgi:hypothetical protein